MHGLILCVRIYIMITAAKNLIESELDIIKDNISKSSVKLPYGKLIRSRTGLLVIKAMGLVCNETYLKFLTAAELIHNASLLHDDVIDNEETRRDKKTLNYETNNKTAVLSGNLVLTEALENILSTGSVKLLSIANSAVKNMCRGELMQKEQEFKIPKLEQYIEKTKLKTGTLFMSLMEGISEISQCGYKDELISFGENFGIAFQIQNDLKNISGSDLKNGIYTAPIIFSQSTDIKEQALKKTSELINEYVAKAENALEFLSQSEYKDALIGAAECLKS